VCPSPAGKPRQVFHWTDANGGVPNKYFLGCRIQPMRGATCDFCATCDFWTLKRNSCIKKYHSGVCPSLARETAPGFSLRGRGAPQKRWFFWGPTPAAQTQAFSGRRLPAPQNRKTSRGVRRMPQFRKGQSGNRPAGRRARATARRARCRTCLFRGGAEHACCRACYVPVRGPAGFAFYQPVQIDDEGSLYISPFTGSLFFSCCLQVATCCLPCSLQGYRAATAAA
jgi:hypothetical protein